MANHEAVEPVLIESIRDTMRRLSVQDWEIKLERLDFGSLMELHRFVLTVEAERRRQRV